MKEFEHAEIQNQSFIRMELLHNFGSISYRYAFSAKDDNNNFYAIPACTGNIMKYDVENGILSFEGCLKNKDFAYTGGAFDAKRNCIWGFPRNSDYLLKIDTKTGAVEEIPLGIKFESSGIHGAHHYSGVLIDDCIYCPPRSTSYGILKIPLDTFKAEVIPLDVYAGVNTHYSGSILHPDGDIIFLPSAHNKVAIFSPETEKVDFIGEKADYMNFGGALWKDGNIYSFCEKGIIKIDIHSKVVEMVNIFQVPQTFYGTIMHPNGKLYAFGGNNVYEYDLSDNKLAIRARFHDIKGNYACNTMGEVMSDGNIYLVPCQGRFFMRFTFG